MNLVARRPESYPRGLPWAIPCRYEPRRRDRSGRSGTMTAAPRVYPSQPRAFRVRVCFVRACWIRPSAPNRRRRSAGLGDKYSYEDTLPTPRLLVENERETSYRLLDFGGLILYDEMEGIRGRPTSGVLGALFQVIGTGRLVWTRMAVSEDGLLLIRAKAKKFVSKTITAVVSRDGTGAELPPDRADLLDLAESLERPLEIAYHPGHSEATALPRSAALP